MQYLKSILLVILSFIPFSCMQQNVQIPDPLPSWNEGQTKQSIFNFVAGVTDKNGPDYVKPSDRIATFDNDGTLLSEKP